MRISLKDILVIVACCALVFACASYVGFDDGLFWFGIVGTGTLSAFLVCFTTYERYGAAIATVLVIGFLGLMLGSWAMIALAVVWFVATAFLAGRVQPLGARSLTVFATAVGLGAVVIGMLPTISRLREMRELRREFAPVSLAHRLNYENRPRAGDSDQTPFMNASLSKRLTDFESDLEGQSGRRWELQRLHSDSYESFVRTQDFGVGRMKMRPVSNEWLRLPPLRDIRWDDTSVRKDVTPEAFADRFAAFMETRKPRWLQQAYVVARSDFLSMASFGAIIAPSNLVAGFVEHGFRAPPTANMPEPRRYKIDRLELVSLLKFDEPRVYVLDHLPRMDQLSSENVPTRTLDAFEADALPKLRTEEDLVILQDGTNYRMLGSLRAAKQCLDCHNAQRGELLGAFSYAIREGVSVGTELAADGR